MRTSENKKPIWTKLEKHSKILKKKTLRDLFELDPNRNSYLSTQFGDIWIDISKQKLTKETIVLFSELIEESNVYEYLKNMLNGEPVNKTENRPALHTALRSKKDANIKVNGFDVVPEIQKNLKKMSELSNAIRDGKLLGATGLPIRSVVAIGVGGSNLGISMACKALSQFAHPDLDIRFSSNVDGSAITDALEGLEPEATIFVITSKSFTTSETMTSMKTAKSWLKNSIPVSDLSSHLIAITGAQEKALDLGIEPKNIFQLPEWVGGRFSLASAAGLVLMISIGPELFKELLSGMRLIDEKIISEPINSNGALILGVLDVWNRSFFDHQTMAVVPYSSRMSEFPAFLQQLMMESLGKQNPIDHSIKEQAIGSIIWGSVGTDSQHAFFQFLHQGGTVVPCDLIGFVNSDNDPRNAHHSSLFANLIAQSKALAFGNIDTSPELEKEKTLIGDRPSTVIIAPELTPRVLGQLIALYEHRTVIAGIVWGVNPFDQWGVELGKKLARSIETELNGQDASLNKSHDSSTQDLIKRFKELRKNQE